MECYFDSIAAMWPYNPTRTGSVYAYYSDAIVSYLWNIDGYGVPFHRVLAFCKARHAKYNDLRYCIARANTDEDGKSDWFVAHTPALPGVGTQFSTLTYLITDLDTDTPTVVRLDWAAQVSHCPTRISLEAGGVCPCVRGMSTIDYYSARATPCHSQYLLEGAPPGVGELLRSLQALQTESRYFLSKRPFTADGDTIAGFVSVPYAVATGASSQYRRRERRWNLPDITLKDIADAAVASRDRAREGARTLAKKKLWCSDCVLDQADYCTGFVQSCLGPRVEEDLESVWATFAPYDVRTIPEEQFTREQVQRLVYAAGARVVTDKFSSRKPYAVLGGFQYRYGALTYAVTADARPYTRRECYASYEDLVRAIPDVETTLEGYTPPAHIFTDATYENLQAALAHTVLRRVTSGWGRAHANLELYGIRLEANGDVYTRMCCASSADYRQQKVPHLPMRSTRAERVMHAVHAYNVHQQVGRRREPPALPEPKSTDTAFDRRVLRAQRQLVRGVDSPTFRFHLPVLDPNSTFNLWTERLVHPCPETSQTTLPDSSSEQ